ncbi:hypothetical protein MASR2M39_10050 [Ignavibacteriales bacterium]
MKNLILPYDNPYVLWGIDGNFDLNFIAKGDIFASTDHCGTIEILNDKISPEYLMISLYLKKYEYGFDRGLRPNLVNVRNIDINIPVDDDDNFDLEIQFKLFENNNQITNIQNRIKEIKVLIEESEVVFYEDFEHKEISLSELFTIKQGNAYYTKKRFLGNKWHGHVPVYSSNTRRWSFNECSFRKNKNGRFILSELSYMVRGRIRWHSL